MSLTRAQAIERALRCALAVWCERDPGGDGADGETYRLCHDALNMPADPSLPREVAIRVAEAVRTALAPPCDESPSCGRATMERTGLQMHAAECPRGAAFRADLADIVDRILGPASEVERAKEAVAEVRRLQEAREVRILATMARRLIKALDDGVSPDEMQAAMGDLETACKEVETTHGLS